MTGSGGDYYGAYGSSSHYKGSMDTNNVATYYWNNKTDNNTWSESNLNTVNLNTNYLNNIGSTWSNKIANHSWKVGGAAWDNVYNGTARTAYNYEVGSNSSSTTYTAKIGLMYASDYGFAASNSNWTTNLHYYHSITVRDNNWMYMGLNEWTISRDSYNSNVAFFVDGDGTVFNDIMNDYMIRFAVRPVFYLTSSTNYVSGSGTADDPIRLS